MADGTKIEWADATVNYVNGCSLASPGCTNCYAMRLAGTRLKHHPTRAGLTQDTKAGPVWTGEVRENPAVLEQALRWKKPRAIFWNAHGDLFHENVPDEWIDKQFAVMALTPQHRHMVLTKRSARMRAYLTDPSVWDRIYEIVCDWTLERNLKVVLRHPLAPAPGPHLAKFPEVWLGQEPLPNVWLGVSVEDQRRADERIPDLLETPAAIRFISAEPLLGPVDLEHIEYYPGFLKNALTGKEQGGHCPDGPGLDWVIVGGESGPNARPMHPEWARSLRDQCADAGVPFHFKQWGNWHPSRDHDDVGCSASPPAIHVSGCFETRPTEVLELLLEPGWEPVCSLGKKRAGRLLDGIQHDGVPA